MRTTLLFVLLVTLPCGIFAGPVSASPVSCSAHVPALDDEVTELLAMLSDRKIEDKAGIRIEGPSLQTQEEVAAKILAIASQSPEARAKVIFALMRVLEDPTAKKETFIATRWIAAVKLLGSLKATEAIDSLIENLDETGQTGIILSIHFRPVTRTLINIGQPAMPKLIEALSHRKPSIRSKAASALAEIGGNEAIKALERAATIETDQDVLKTIKAALPRKPSESRIAVTREASSGACSGGQVVAATFHLAGGGDNYPTLQRTACARAPVEMTRMIVKPDGSYSVILRNLDNNRQVVGVSYWVTAIDSKGNVDGEPHFVSSLLTKSAEPGAEMIDDSERSPRRISLEKATTYLVQFVGVLFAPFSEWQFKADCSSTGDLTQIRCKPAKE